METASVVQKILKHTSIIDEQIADARKGFQKDVLNIIEFILMEYDVRDRDTLKIVHPKEIIDKIPSKLKLGEFDNPQLCCGVSKSNKRCGKKVKNGQYCKLHEPLYKNVDAIVKNKSNDYSNELNYNNKINKKLVFVEDSFYYADEYFLYAQDTKEKCGVIDDGAYILTDDPFMLGTIEL
jgi:hypothetical protein